ncbi:MAG: prolipoprotein diacylglyceryl transferase [Clostridia bacterium]|nr:prolipoprotein diacylglyceryl transferase [Clostridia bacterium]
MHPDPIFTIFGKGVYLYGICMALGIIACFVFLVITMKIKKFNEASSDTILFIGVFGTGFGILCAALFQATYNYIDNPDAGFKLNSMTFLGGLIGGVASFLGVYFLYMYVVRPRVKVSFLTLPMNATLTDALPFIPIAITIAHAFGRLGCFFGGCCYGREAEWGLPCADAVGLYGVNVIPTQLFEMSFLILLGVAMAVLYFKFKFNYNFAVYMIAYGIWRFIIEYFRADYRGSMGSALTPSQIWSIIMVILGVGYVFLQYYVLKKHMKHPELDEKEEKTPEDKPQTTEN